MFQYFLVSSDVHKEKNALSEAAWILSTYVNIQKIEPRLLPIGGLGLLTLQNSSKIDIPENVTHNIEKIQEEEEISYCKKIIPLNKYEIYSKDHLVKWISQEVNPNISSTQNWRVTVNKRHSSIKSREIINLIASMIQHGNVNLNEPDLIIQIEFLGKFSGFSLLRPYQILKLTD